MTWSTFMQLSNSEVAELRFALKLRLEDLERRLASSDLSVGELRIRATESLVLCKALIWRLDVCPVMRGAPFDEARSREG